MKRWLMMMMAAFLFPVAGAQEEKVQVSVSHVGVVYGKDPGYVMTLRVRPARVGDQVMAVRSQGMFFSDERGHQIETEGESRTQRSRALYQKKGQEGEKDVFTYGKTCTVKASGILLKGKSIMVKGSLEVTHCRGGGGQETVKVDLTQFPSFQAAGVSFEVTKYGEWGIELKADHPEMVASIAWVSQGKALPLLAVESEGEEGETACYRFAHPEDVGKEDFKEMELVVSTYGQIETLQVPLSFRVGICGVVAPKKKEGRK